MREGSTRLGAAPLLVLLLLVAGCAPAGDPASNDAADAARGDDAKLAAINALIGEFVVAMNSGDAAALAALYTEDGIRNPPNAKAIVGREKIEIFQGANFVDSEINLQLRLEETTFSGDLAFCRGTLAFTTTNRETGDSVSTVGKWMNLSRLEEDGKWRIAREMWNSDEPAS